MPSPLLNAIAYSLLVAPTPATIARWNLLVPLSRQHLPLVNTAVNSTTRQIALNKSFVSPKGRNRFLQVIIILLHLEKEAPKTLEQLVRVYGGSELTSSGAAFMVGYGVYPGVEVSSKDTPSPAALALNSSLPTEREQEVSGDCSVDTAKGERGILCQHALKYHVISGRSVARPKASRWAQFGTSAPARANKCDWVGLKFAVSISCIISNDSGKLEQYVLSTKTTQGKPPLLGGKRRWQIEGWFKTAKHRFGLHRFGQGTLGSHRWLAPRWTAYLPLRYSNSAKVLWT